MLVVSSAPLPRECCLVPADPPSPRDGDEGCLGWDAGGRGPRSTAPAQARRVRDTRPGLASTPTPACLPAPSQPQSQSQRGGGKRRRCAAARNALAAGRGPRAAARGTGETSVRDAEGGCKPCELAHRRRQALAAPSRHAQAQHLDFRPEGRTAASGARGATGAGGSGQRRVGATREVKHRCTPLAPRAHAARPSAPLARPDPPKTPPPSLPACQAPRPAPPEGQHALAAPPPALPPLSCMHLRAERRRPRLPPSSPPSPPRPADGAPRQHGSARAQDTLAAHPTHPTIPPSPPSRALEAKDLSRS